MILTTVNHDFRYELEKLCRIFLPFEKIEIIDTLAEGNAYANTVCERGEEKTRLYAALSLFGKTREYETEIENNSPDYTADCEREIATCLYHCFCDITGYTPPWGILTGVRPAKLYSRLASANGGEDAEQYFKEKLLVSDEKISLCRETNASEEKIVSLSAPESFSLYISIPFCPTRCSYCSFVSHSVEHAKKLIPEYVKLLCEELKITAGYAARNHLRLETIYMGGGTPTTLTAEQMDTVLSVVRENFDLSNLREFTVEAGRPDTITREKLEVIKKNGVDRISINPQTMNDSVLSAIGRRHTAEETEKAFYLARECGFDNINMDLIAGLPTDTVENYIETLRKALSFSPENITVHTLALKRSSTIVTEKRGTNSGETASKMLSITQKALLDEGYIPYYMYRQSKCLGNLENVGWAKKGYEGLYNVYMMEEIHSVFAVGAGAVTKLKAPYDSSIERVFNYKYPYEYIGSFDEIIKRKEQIKIFYDKYFKG